MNKLIIFTALLFPVLLNAQSTSGNGVVPLPKLLNGVKNFGVVVAVEGGDDETIARLKRVLEGRLKTAGFKVVQSIQPGDMQGAEIIFYVTSQTVKATDGSTFGVQWAVLFEVAEAIPIPSSLGGKFAQVVVYDDVIQSIAGQMRFNSELTNSTNEEFDKFLKVYRSVQSQ